MMSGRVKAANTNSVVSDVTKQLGGRGDGVVTSCLPDYVGHSAHPRRKGLYLDFKIGTVIHRTSFCFPQTEN